HPTGNLGRRARTRPRAGCGTPSVCPFGEHFVRPEGVLAEQTSGTMTSTPNEVRQTMAERDHPDRPGHRETRAHASRQTFEYPLRREFAEPDWRRIPGFRDATEEQWQSAQWQRAHTVKNLTEFRRVLGEHLDDALGDDILRDQQERATMSMLIPPQMINTMDVGDLRGDRVRRYMAPAH